MTCDHGFIGACAECDGSGQAPTYEPIGVYGCAKCGADLRAVGCCCSHATYDDGSFEDGFCRDCCGPHSRVLCAGVGGYERADCDQ